MNASMRLSEPDHGGKLNFAALDMLRGIAAIAVVFRHLNHSNFYFLPSSGLAVDLFFVLSGFVVAHAYEAKLCSSMSFRSFVEIRIARLYPMYIAGTLGVAVGIALLTVSEISWEKLAFTFGFAILFLPTPQSMAYGGFHIYPLNFPAWSLLWELAINFLYALIAKWLNNVLLIMILVVGVLLLGGAAWWYGDLTGGSTFLNMWAGPMRVVYSFFAGVGCYRLWRSRRFVWLRLNLFSSVAILLVIFAVRPANAGLYDFLITLLLFPVLVLATCDAKVGRFSAICALLGNISYPVYTIHAAFLPIEQAFYKYASAPAAVMRIPVEVMFVAVIVGAACIAEILYDRPLRAHAKRWLATRRSGEVRLEV